MTSDTNKFSAFSAYRYEAVQNSTATSGPLVEYFKGEVLHHSADFDVSSANKYAYFLTCLNPFALIILGYINLTTLHEITDI